MRVSERERERERERGSKKKERERQRTKKITNDVNMFLSSKEFTRT